MRARSRDEPRRTRTRRAFAVAAGVVVLGLGVVLVRLDLRPAPVLESDIVVRQGLHWHPELAISVKGVRQDIPEGIGLGLTEHGIHTHDATGVIHLEFPGLVRKDDTRLGEFFRVWGKRFDASCLFEYCNGPDGKVTLSVNGQENGEFGDYLMRDKDKLEIRYE